MSGMKRIMITTFAPFGSKCWSHTKSKPLHLNYIGARDKNMILSDYCNNQTFVPNFRQLLLSSLINTLRVPDVDYNIDNPPSPSPATKILAHKASKIESNEALSGYLSMQLSIFRCFFRENACKTWLWSSKVLKSWGEKLQFIKLEQVYLVVIESNRFS